ncbi:MAG: GEVED domain-containing protein [Sphingobacteriaceae bacterium]|jgi:hypothetical protein
MKKIYTFLLLLFATLNSSAQSWNSAPYCTPSVGVWAVPCSQGGPSNDPTNWINDFINGLYTTGAVTNINNQNSGCNGLPNNYIFYCNHPLQVNAGQTVSLSIQSASVYASGFAVFIDWNQDNVFQIPGEKVAFTAGIPPAGSWSVISFTVPASQPNGTYRMRVRSSYATPGNSIDPCNFHSYGETEDYSVYVGTAPPSSSAITATASPNQTVCIGQNANLSVSFSGTTSTTFNWSGPNSFTSSVQNPTVLNTISANNGFYHVSIGTSTCPTMAKTHVYIALSNLSITSTNSVICSGASVTLTASGSNNYTWSPGNLTNTVAVFSPTTTTAYTLASTSTNSCIGTKIYTVTVNICNSLFETSEEIQSVNVYPNPSKDLITVQIGEAVDLKMLNHVGKLILQKELTKTEVIDISELPAGIYYLLIKGNNGTEPIKVIKD